jgi:ABC-type antimicrobial peptide transport system permease subunit
MGKGKLSGILFREMLITALTASGIGTIAGVILTGVINASASNSDAIDMAITTDPVKTLLFFVLLVAAFTGTVLFPIKNLGKMKIAEQIKYE